MALVNVEGLATNNNTNKTTNKTDRPKSKFWLNVGVDINGEFISVPMGIPLDNIEPVKVPQAKDTEESIRYVLIQQVKNQLLGQLIQKAEALQPGEATILNLRVELRHANTEAVQVAAPDEIKDLVASLI